MNENQKGGISLEFWEMLLLGTGLAMDATAVSMTNGMCIRNAGKREAFLIAVAFGGFQGLMPLIGYLTGALFTEYINRIDHWIAFLLLGYIGGKMVLDALSHKEECVPLRSLSFRLLLVQSISTSIDAFAVGVSLAALSVPIFASCGVIATITFLFSFVAVFIGKRFGDLLGQKAQLVGGILLIAIGGKIFIQHLFF